MQIILVHPRIPQNAGAVARLAAATHCRLTIVRPLGFRLEDRRARRAGLDYWDAADVAVAECLDETLRDVSGTAYFFTRAAERPFWDVAFQENDALVFGNEEQGLPAEVIAAAPPERRLRIPILNSAVRSLNLATSVAVAVYEARRQFSLSETDGRTNRPVPESGGGR